MPALLRTCVLALGSVLLLVACAAGGNGASPVGAEVPTPGQALPPPDLRPASDAQGQPLVEQALPVGSDTAAAPGQVDTACRTDADCAVKDVGSCCGYYPACVNAGSPTFPEQVKADCEKQGLMSTCGFREISRCACVDGRCQAADAGEGPVR